MHNHGHVSEIFSSDKHIALKYHHFHSFVKDGRITISYCRTTEQKADILTKPLADDLFFKLRYMLCGWQFFSLIAILRGRGRRSG